MGSWLPLLTMLASGLYLGAYVPDWREYLLYPLILFSVLTALIDSVGKMKKIGQIIAGLDLLSVGLFLGTKTMEHQKSFGYAAVALAILTAIYALVMLLRSKD